MIKEDFMGAEEHFGVLVGQLHPESRALYDTSYHLRIETAYKGRNFILYEVEDGLPKVLDRVIVRDFECNEKDGASTQVTLQSTDEERIIGYGPEQVFDFPVFMWLPLTSRVRWGAPASNPYKGSLGFPLVLKTKSRLSLREPGVVYCETAASFAAEFGNAYF